MIQVVVAVSLFPGVNQLLVLQYGVRTADKLLVHDPLLGCICIFAAV